jgi:RNA polymerase sigma-70 factor (ECF subfamily)
MSDNTHTNREEFEKEALPHMDALYSFAYNLCGNADDASDLLQETYLKAFRFFHTFQKGTNCKAWLFQIMKNSFINRYRQKKREPEKVSYDVVEDFYETIKDDAISLDTLQQELFDNVLDDQVADAIKSLPEAFRTVLILSDIEEYTYEEIAKIIDAPIGTVRSRLHRARKVMQSMLLDFAKTKGISPNRFGTETG